MYSLQLTAVQGVVSLLDGEFLYTLSEVFLGCTEYLFGRSHFLCGDLTPRFNGTPGGIRTPDHLVRRQVLENALQPINKGISLLRLSQTNQNF